MSECVLVQHCGDSNAEMGTELNNEPVVKSDTAIHAQETSFSRTKFKSKNASTEAAVPLTLTLPIAKKHGIGDIRENQYQNGGIIPDLINWVGRSEGDYGVRSKKMKLVETIDSGGN